MDSQTITNIRRILNEARKRVGKTTEAIAREAAQQFGDYPQIDYRTPLGVLLDASEKLSTQNPHPTSCLRIAEVLEKKFLVPGVIQAITEELEQRHFRSKERASSGRDRNTMPEHRYLGRWFSYRATLPEHSLVPVVDHRVWDVELSDSGTYVVHSRGDEDTEAFYRGTLHAERNFVVIRLQSVVLMEEILIRLRDPVRVAPYRATGLYLSMGYRHDSIAGPIAISRALLPEETAAKILSSIFHFVKCEALGLGVLCDQAAGAEA